VSQSEDGIGGYDVVGDIHGCAGLLAHLLDKMGYREVSGVYRHPSRKVVFLGDFIDRGNAIRDVVSIAKKMVDAGAAYAVMGNHEYNAILYAAAVCDDLPSVPDFRRQHLAVLLSETHEQYKGHEAEWQVALNWFKSLPLYLEFDEFRVVHACWDHQKILNMDAINLSSNSMSDSFLKKTFEIGATTENRVVERLLKGTDLSLPEGMTLTGLDGVARTRFRTRFWAFEPEIYGDVVFQPDRLPATLAERYLTEIEKSKLVYYPEDERPLFVGHYWRQGEPELIRSNVACLDYGAVKSGKLVAYRMDANAKKLEEKYFCWVPVDDING